ncbi:MAG: type II secretion system protein [Gemmatimonadota bacterium]|nr:type II secretion system protein [Gemmatimonadota bacterium]
MKRSHTGFTMIELIIAILIGSILTTIALSRISDAQSRVSVRGAKSTYASVHYRARAHGIEMGENVMLHVESGGDSVWIEHDGAVLEKVRLGNEQNVDMRITPSGAPTDFTLCFSPRGYTDVDCNSTNSILRVEFWQGADSTSLLVLPMGQLVTN